MDYSKRDNTLYADGHPLLTGVDAGITLDADAAGCGVFLRAAGEDRSTWSVELGAIAGLDRFTLCFRGESPFWMEPAAGDTLDAVPTETQWLLARFSGGYLLLAPLVDGALRFCLAGGTGVLRLLADSGDPDVRQAAGVGAFLAVGADPYRLLDAGAAAVQRRLKLGRLRRDKPLPDFVDHFGWCTWNAFYREVTAEKVRQGLERFRALGVPPAFLILDDGWQSTQTLASGEIRLSSFAANGKFPGGLAPLIAEAREAYGIRRFLVWHAVMGYWGGVDADRLPGYGVREVERVSPPTFANDMLARTAWMGRTCAVVSPECIQAFYDDYHRTLVEQGVDGVKIDNQASLEFTTAGFGGRVALSLAFRRAMEASCRRHFDGRLINCMSNAGEMHLMAQDSTLMRTSTDFWPDIPKSHGFHLYANAQVSLWFGQFVHPDWDMFVSGHPRGAYHAAARAISGGPVYAADAPEQIDASVLRKLVAAGGGVFRCRDIARPSPDCLMHDPTREPLLLKIFNRNAHGAVIGVFHAQTGDEAATRLAGSVSVADVPGWPCGRVAVWAHRAGTLTMLEADGAQAVALDPGEWELFTLSPDEDGLAVIGLADKYNSGGAVEDLERRPGGVAFRLLDGGRLALAAARRPSAITCDGVPVPFDYDAATGAVLANVPAAGCVVVQS